MTSVNDHIRVGSLRLKNRFIVEPSFTNSATESGFVNGKLLAEYEERARGGAALVIVEITFVHENGRGFNRQLGVHSDNCLGGLKELSDTIRRAGAKSALQIFHGGAITDPKWSGSVPISPTSGPTFQDTEAASKSFTREMTESDIKEIIDAYVNGARRVREAGFDAVDVHACHGSLIHQFLSPAFNKRTDKWGKDRSLFATEIIKGIRKKAGEDFPILWKISADEFFEGGIDLEYTKRLVKLYEECGVSLLRVSAGGIMSNKALMSTIQPLYYPMACLVDFAKEIKTIVKIPVGTVGKIMDPRIAESIVSTGKADIICLSRPIIADPYYPKKAIKKDYDGIRKCIGCNVCLTSVYFKQLSIRCAVNPRTGYYDKFDMKLTRTHQPKHIMVVGAGPGGMEAARVLATRGHSVEIYEKENKAGGLVNIASSFPKLYTKNLSHIVDYQLEQLKRMNVPIRLGVEVGPTLINKESPDVLILATGSRPKDPAFTKRDGLVVMSLDQFMKSSPVENPKKAVVYGAEDGIELALSLGRAGSDVTVVETSGNHLTTRYMHDPLRTLYLMEELGKAGVKTILNGTVTEAGGKSVTVSHDGSEETITNVDALIVSLGRKPDQTLYDEIRDAFKGDVYMIGDCVEPVSVWKAIESAYNQCKDI